jgi:hypothetical protein
MRPYSTLVFYRNTSFKSTQQMKKLHEDYVQVFDYIRIWISIEIEILKIDDE